MLFRLSNHQLSELSRIIQHKTGLSFPPNKYKDLLRGLNAYQKDKGIPLQAIIELKTLSEETLLELIGYLTIGETYFFRDLSFLRMLEREILRKWRHPPLLPKKIWSAGCSSGEEPYTIAMLLDKGRDTPSSFPLTILASDINPAALNKAQKGVYTSWSIRDMPEEMRHKYFLQSSPDQFMLNSRIKAAVRFFQLNLIEPLYPAAENNTQQIHLLFCRNVLMYFDPRQRERVVNRLVKALAQDGYLVVSPCETSLIAHPQLIRINQNGRFIFQKLGTPHLRTPRPLELPAPPNGLPPQIPTKKATAT